LYGALVSVLIAAQLLAPAGEYSNVTESIVRPDEGAAVAVSAASPRKQAQFGP
jgi:hypothetical protein